MEERWKYLSKSGERVGPIDEATLAQHYQDGLINSETLICREAINKWCKIGELKDLEERLVTFEVRPTLISEELSTPQPQSARPSEETNSVLASLYEVGLSVYKFIRLILVKTKSFTFLLLDPKFRYGAIAVILLLLAFTNPTMDDYAKTLRQGFLEEAADPKADMFNMLFGGWADSFIANVTTRRNFILFSTYQTEFGPFEASCIGALTTFLWCSKENKEE